MKSVISIGLTLLSLSIWVGCNSKPKQGESSRTVSSFQDPATPWAYDPGPSPETAMGKELIDIVARQPYMPGISQEMTGEQKFRPAFGPTLWRMIDEPNSVKILFIGQDGTHIAEAAGRTATAGFGGRAQDLAAYFGVNTGAAFMNTFAFTIKGQYGAFQAPIISEENGYKKVSLGTVVDNGMWMMAQDQNSPMVKWRNSLIDWIIRNNRESLRMVVLFGGSAQDSIGTFIESHGGKVGSRFSADDIAQKNIRIPEFALVSAGSNKVFPALLDKNGKDIYPTLVGRKLDYSKPEDQKDATTALTKKISSIYDDLKITNAGVGGSGVVSPAQINGYDLNKIYVNGEKTLSLKGLKLSDGSQIQNDVLVAEFPHPTSLSLLTPTEASTKIQQSLKQLTPYVKAGWKIGADANMTNHFQAGELYKYSRTDIPHAYYDFGTPNNRMVSKSDASRMTGHSNVVILGTRDKAQFDNAQITHATAALPNSPVAVTEMFTARPRLESDRYLFDHGPGPQMARIMKESLDLAVIGALKPGYKLKHGVKMEKGETVADVADVDGFNIKTHPSAVGDFGHYRGSFEKPEVLILADPDGNDEILTSRAMTGTRGQYLQGLMNALGFSENHLVIRTVPFGMDGASDEEWTTVLRQTENYRSRIFAELFRRQIPKLILADGPYAQKEMERIAKGYRIPVVNIRRPERESAKGMKAAMAEINKLRDFKDLSGEPVMANIPRSHLGFMARVWEGTSGTRVFNSISPEANGIAFAVVVPNWAFRQKDVQQDSQERMDIERLKGTLQENHIPLIQPQVQALDDAG